MKRFALLLLCLALLPTGKAQQYIKNFDYGLVAGASYYMGDINPTYHFDLPGLALGAMFRTNLDQRFAIRTSIVYSRLAGSDYLYANEFKQTRGASFITNVLDFAVAGEFNFFPFDETNPKHRFTPYFTAGLGSTYFITQKQPYFGVVIPFGVGIKIKLAERLNLAFEWGPRKTFTDDIEGMGEAVFPGGTHYYGKQKYFASDNDWFYTTVAILSFKFYESRGGCRAYVAPRRMR